MIKVKIFDGGKPSFVESLVNKFFEESGRKFGGDYRLHYSTTHQDDDSIIYSVLIEYDDSG